MGESPYLPSSPSSRSRKVAGEGSLISHHHHHLIIIRFLRNPHVALRSYVFLRAIYYDYVRPVCA